MCCNIAIPSESRSICILFGRFPRKRNKWDFPKNKPSIWRYTHGHGNTHLSISKMLPFSIPCKGPALGSRQEPQPAHEVLMQRDTFGRPWATRRTLRFIINVSCWQTPPSAWGIPWARWRSPIWTHTPGTGMKYVCCCGRDCPFQWWSRLHLVHNS